MKIQYSFLTAALFVAAVACAQPTTMPADKPEGAHGPGMECKTSGGMHHGHMMEWNFFPPELVMRHQKDIGLTPDQEMALRSQMVKFVGHVTDLRWQESAEKEELMALLQQPSLDEKALLAQKEKLLKIEDDLQLSHLAMLIEIKNALTPEQQQKLTELKKGMEHHRWGGHMWGEHMMMHHGEGGFTDGPRIPANPQ